VEKVKNACQKYSKKHHGEARLLTVEELERAKVERQEREDTEEEAKKRRMALRGLKTFVRNVWKEYKFGCNVFDCE